MTVPPDTAVLATYAMQPNCTLVQVSLVQIPLMAGPVQNDAVGAASMNLVYQWLRTGGLSQPPFDLRVSELNPQLMTTWSWDGTSFVGDQGSWEFAEHAHRSPAWTVSSHSANSTGTTATTASFNGHWVYSGPYTVTFDSNATVGVDGSSTCTFSTSGSWDGTWLLSRGCYNVYRGGAYVSQGEGF